MNISTSNAIHDFKNTKALLSDNELNDANLYIRIYKSLDSSEESRQCNGTMLTNLDEED